MLKRRFSLLVLILSGMFPLMAIGAPKESLLYVQVRQSKLRSAPEFWAQTLADLSYGAVLTSMSAAPSDKTWIKVKIGSTEGFVHVSAITRRKIILNANAELTKKGVDQSSIVLAGKGFNNQVENKFKSAQGLDFGPVDEVERLGVDASEESAFIKDGKLVS